MPLCKDCGSYYVKGECPRCFPESHSSDVWQFETLNLAPGALASRSTEDSEDKSIIEIDIIEQQEGPTPAEIDRKKQARILRQIKEMDEKIGKLDAVGKRLEAGDLCYEKALLLLQQNQIPARGQTALAFYHSALRYLMGGHIDRIRTVLGVVSDNKLEGAHPKLYWLVDRILREQPELSNLFE